MPEAIIHDTVHARRIHRLLLIIREIRDLDEKTDSNQEKSMPYVNIKITREGATAEQKALLIRGVTRLLADVLGKKPATTVVVIYEVETDNWGIGGEPVTALRRKRKEG